MDCKVLSVLWSLRLTLLYGRKWAIIVGFLSVQPLCALCLCGDFILELN